MQTCIFGYSVCNTGTYDKIKCRIILHIRDIRRSGNIWNSQSVIITAPCNTQTITGFRSMFNVIGSVLSSCNSSNRQVSRRRCATYFNGFHPYFVLAPTHCIYRLGTRIRAICTALLIQANSHFTIIRVKIIITSRTC